MVKFYVTAHDMDTNEQIAERETLQLYCKSQQMENYEGHVREVLQSAPRREHYIKRTSDGVTVGSFFIMYALDMHHGYIALLSAQWVHPMYRNQRVIQQLTKAYIREFCREYGCAKYQRSKHLSPSIQIQITKEV